MESSGQHILSWLMKPRLFKLLLAFLLLLILGGAVFMGHFQLAHEIEKTVASNQSTANFLARITMEQNKAVLGVLQSYASRPRLIAAAKEKSPSKAIKHLTNLIDNNPAIEEVFITDPQGTLWVNFPVDEQSHGKNFRYRDWYGGVSREWRPYISGVYQRLTGAKDLAVAVCLPIRDEKDTVIGILGASQPASLLTQRIKQVDPDPLPHVTLLDQRGNIIYSDRIPTGGKVVLFPETPFLARALLGETVEIQYRDSSDGNRLKYAAFAPVSDLGWTVIVEKTEGKIWASAADHFIYQGAIFLLSFLLIAFSLGYLRRGLITARMLELRRIDETLRQSALEVKRLAEENAILAEIGRLVTSSLDIKAIYAQFAMRVRSIIHFDWLTITLLNSDGKTGTFAYGEGHGVEDRREGVVFPLPGTITDHLAHSPSGLIVDADTPEDLQDRFPFLLPNFESGLRSFMGVPLLHRDICIGCLIFHATACRAYGESHLRLAERIADQIAGAVANARMFHEMKQMEEALKRSQEHTLQLAKENAVLAEIGRIISSNLKVEDIYDQFAKEVQKLISFDRISVNLIQGNEESVVITYTSGINIPNREKGKVFPLKGSLLAKMIDIRSGLILHPSPTPESAEAFPSLLPNLKEGFRSFLGVPLICHDRMIGNLVLHMRRPQAYQEYDLQLGQRIADQIAGAIANAQLFAEQIRAEEQIKASLHEKEILLKEIHHRVKNNLQVISSLLNWQSHHIQDPSALEIFKESQNRVKLIALIHEKLYQSKDLAKINFREYVRSLSDHIFHSYQTGSKEVSLQIDIQDIYLGIDKAIPCGMVINELISNSFKHAFSASNHGEISLSLKPNKEGRLILTVKDNGTGLPPNYDFRSAESVGMQLVNILTSQMEGTIELDRQKGTEFQITFPAE